MLKIHISFIYTESINKLYFVLAYPPNKIIYYPIVHELWPHLGHGRGVLSVLVFTGFHCSFYDIFLELSFSIIILQLFKWTNFIIF